MKKKTKNEQPYRCTHDSTRSRCCKEREPSQVPGWASKRFAPLKIVRNSTGGTFDPLWDYFCGKFVAMLGRKQPKLAVVLALVGGAIL